MQQNQPLTVRRIRFDWDTDVDPDRWHHALPEFGAGANAVSLLMPHAEPFVISAVRRGLSECERPDESLSSAVQLWASQEAAHFGAHRAFNRRLTERSRIARMLDRVANMTFAAFGRRSAGFGVAFAAAFELVAFSAARWAEAGLRRYFEGADARSATLFLWHLAEEIEHKGVAHDVLDAHPTARRKLPLAMIVAFVALMGFTALGGLALFIRTPAALNPFRWARLIGWGFSMAFVVLPVLAGSFSDSFHPSQLVDPPWMARWLSEYDPATKTLPLWTDAGSGTTPGTAHALNGYEPLSSSR